MTNAIDPTASEITKPSYGELVAELKSLADRFERACRLTGSANEHAALAVAKTRALIAKAEGRTP